MKIALIFLIVLSLVAISYQQNKRMLWPQVPLPYYSPRTLYYPFLTADDSSEIDSPIVDDDGIDEWPIDQLIQSRNKNYIRPQSQQQQQRFFFGAFNPFNPIFSALIRTTQVTSTFSSTILSAVITSCIPVSLFTTTNPSVCSRRKRRDLMMLMDFEQQLQDEDQLFIAPSGVNQVVPTEAVAMPRNSHQIAEIASSKDEEEADEMQRRFKRRNDRTFNNNFVVTLTTTSTTYVFNSTLIKRTILLGPTPVAPATTGVLNCLPSGFVLC